MDRYALIVGMGIGQLYKSIYEKLGYKIVTVDSNPHKHADFTDVRVAVTKYPNITIVHVCTPNYTHEQVAIDILETARTVDVMFIEKPGLESTQAWRWLVNSYRGTRIMMVKNNMWRDNIKELAERAKQARVVHLDWINENRVPHPGSWFTTKSLAYGGVSRDLLPHLLSFYIALNPDWQTEKLTYRLATQRHTLDTIDSTDYGVVNPNGTYDVDDYCRLEFGNKWKLSADWALKINDKRVIDFGTDHYEFGLCPEEAYENMIKEAVSKLANDLFWIKQMEYDTFIHERISIL